MRAASSARNQKLTRTSVYARGLVPASRSVDSPGNRGARDGAERKDGEEHPHAETDGLCLAHSNDRLADDGTVRSIAYSI